MFQVLPASFILGVLLYGYFHYISGGQVTEYCRQVFSRSWMILWLRLWLACWLTSFSYFWLKVYVPIINPSLWDDALWRLDAMLHGGWSPSLILTQQLEGSFLVGWLDRWYSLWLASVVLSSSGSHLRLQRKLEEPARNVAAGLGHARDAVGQLSTSSAI